MQPSSSALSPARLDGLRRAAGQDPAPGIRQASQQFEALFLQMMLKSMREATPGDAVLGGATEKFYTGMLDQQLGQSLAGRGLGLAQALERQLTRQVGASEATAGASPGGPGSYRTPAVPPASAPAIPLASAPGVSPVGAQPPGRSAAPISAAPPVGAQPPGRPSQYHDLPLTAYDRTTAAATWSRSALAPAHVERFMAQHLPAAQRASEVSGVPAQLILAQAALESGWGRFEPRGPDGAPSFNLFGIKADRRWRGPSVEADTTEVVQGRARSETARFRAYASYEEAFADHARFLAQNPRYAQVRGSDPQRGAEGLQRAGYATDPLYAAKLKQVLGLL